MSKTEKVSSRIKNLPESVCCNLCAGSFNFLPSHLKKVHQLTAGDYLREYGVQPLHSRGYAEKMRVYTQRPDEIIQNKTFAQEWNAAYRHTRRALADMGYLIPSIAAKQSGIPRTTLYRAMQVGELDFAEASPLIHMSSSSEVRVIGVREVIKLISASDLESYRNKPRYSIDNLS